MLCSMDLRSLLRLTLYENAVDGNKNQRGYCDHPQVLT